MKIIDINDREREVESVTPDPKFAGYVRVQFKRYHEWYTIPEFLEKNPDLKHLTKNAPKIADDLVGIVTQASKNTIKDTTQDWKKDHYLGMYVWISRGKGEGQSRTVVSNTKNTLSVDKDWDILPNKTSQFVITAQLKKTKAMGNTLPQDDYKKLEKQAEKLDRDRGVISKKIKHFKAN
jgi:hypothetical protein